MKHLKEVISYTTEVRTSVENKIYKMDGITVNKKTKRVCLYISEHAFLSVIGKDGESVVKVPHEGGTMRKNEIY